MKRQINRHCKKVLVDYDSVNAFQSYLQTNSFAAQRCGYLYGNYQEDGSVFVECIYEPTQKSEEDSCALLDDKNQETVETIAQLMGLEKVGFIFSHGKRGTPALSSPEIKSIARMQTKPKEQDQRFLIITVSPNSTDSSQVEAFQLSDQCLQLEKENQFSQPVEENTCEVITSVIVEEQETMQIPNQFLVVAVAIGNYSGKMRTRFPIENRPTQTTLEDLKTHLHTAQNLLDALNDFHALLFLSNYLDIKSDLPALCDSLKTSQASGLEGFRVILDALLAGH